MSSRSWNRACRFLGAALLPVTLASPLASQAPPDSAAAMPRRQYEAGPIHRFFLGDHHRELWSLPVTAEVLDLRTRAGGLTPTGLGGGLQTRSLRFSGSDGRRYAFRAIDKDASRTLDPALRQTIAASVLQDQVSALLPASALVVAPLLEAAGVLHANPSLYVMPDDSRLGEFRAEFAGMLGFLEERPGEGPDGEPGFAGATLIENSEDLFDRLEDDPRNRFDDRAFVRARLIDGFVGDWDRHPDQWLWAGFAEDGITRWEAIPRDRDWALSRLDGLLVWVAGFAFPNYKGFDDDYPSALRLSWTGRALDRVLLAATPASAWDSVAADLTRRLTDDVIDGAVRRLPEPYYARIGSDLSRALRNRRDGLAAYAREFYRLLAGDVDLHTTDVNEYADIERIDAAHVRVSVSRRTGDAPSGEPFVSRTFDASETNEVRLFMQGGEDRVMVHGMSGGGIIVRVIGGGGDDVMVDRTGGHGVFFYDDRGDNRFERADATRVDEAEWVERRAPGSQTQQAPARDWGSWWIPVPYLAYEPDAGWYFGGGAIRYGYGFRYFPWKTRLSFSAGIGTGTAGFRGHVDYDFPMRGALRARIYTAYSGADRDYFYGFGNETESTQSAAFYRADRSTATVSFTVAIRPTPVLDLSIGPIYSGTRPLREGRTLLDSLDVHGEGDFDAVGGRASVVLDSRNHRKAASRGVHLRLDTRLFPALLDVTGPFGGVRGEASAYLATDTLGGSVLALRVGGEKLWGRVPWHEAAHIGGATSLRGFANRRFTGNASLFGNAELRIPVFDVFVTLPAVLGVFALADGGRVFVDGESSDKWHAAAGGGVWLAALHPANALSLAIVRSVERTGVYFGAGFAF